MIIVGAWQGMIDLLLLPSYSEIRSAKDITYFFITLEVQLIENRRHRWSRIYWVAPLRTLIKRWTQRALCR